MSRIDDEKEHRWNGGNLEFVDRGRRYSLKMEFFYFVYRNIHICISHTKIKRKIVFQRITRIRIHE